jgi:hypothetical protein
VCWRLSHRRDVNDLQSVHTEADTRDAAYQCRFHFSETGGAHAYMIGILLRVLVFYRIRAGLAWIAFMNRSASLVATRPKGVPP